ncbi:hypothetical protein OG497_37985 [Streptomyces sp. NBC_01242]|uniref:hypothetical protein n=1 Tax=Streptomyces sp. NBC_01242 TaxID=2903795 RepID=UPI00224D4F0D|nr:hypothetical protein [Streptomyces sp. NBC_01242]MCX4799650.1 hypothetical protein [Streptomyces sp. NBC_01242]
MTAIDIHTGQFGSDVLVDPSPETADLLRLLPLTYFRDNGIHTMDFSTWAGAERHYLQSEREHLDKITDQIERYGVLTRVEIAWYGPGYQPHMYNGHHRIVALRRLGWTHAPHRWFDSSVRHHNEPAWQHQTLPWIPQETESRDSHE